MERLWYLGLISASCVYISALDLTPTTGINANNENCTCIPYYLCKNGTIITDGVGIIDIRKTNGVCKDYSLICCKKEDQSPVPLTASYIKPAEGCGYRLPNGIGVKITGDLDNESQFGEFPWMVAVLGNERYQCGGSLIHPSVVLTAGHCVRNKEKKFTIRAGEWDAQRVGEPFPHQDRDVKLIMIHPDYYAGALFNDIALLVLEIPVVISEHINVACLPPQNFTMDAGLCYANGWGKDIFEREGRYQTILKKIGLPQVDRDLCQEKLRSTRLGMYFELNPSFMCAGGEPGKDTCVGDGGGPLACPIENEADRYFQAGIVSWGIGCGHDGIPGVYANVALFRDWIDEQMRDNNFDVTSYQF